MNDIQKSKEQIQHDVKTHDVVLYMKGEKTLPQCGFSARVVDILLQLGVDFETRNVLTDDALRQAIKEFSDWPTLPQLYIRGEFVGGCDIITQLAQNGELQKMLADGVKP